MTLVGVLLAGGTAQRMGGGDKCLLSVGGRAILSHVIERIAPQVGTLALNINGDAGRFAQFQLPVIADRAEGQGPLGGILTGMEWAARHHPASPDILSVPTDTPFLPRDLASRLIEARAKAKADIAIAASGGRGHWVAGLWPVSLVESLTAALAGGASPKVEAFVRTRKFTLVDFDITSVDPFLNINHPADLDTAERLAGAQNP